MASLKSLLSKAHKLGYIAFNPGAALELVTCTPPPDPMMMGCPIELSRTQILVQA